MSEASLLSLGKSLGCLNQIIFFRVLVFYFLIVILYSERIEGLHSVGGKLFGSCIVLKYGAKLHIIIDV